MTRINQLKLTIPVADIAHVVGTLQSVIDMDLQVHVNLEIYVPPNFPKPDATISPEDQKALDDALAESRQALDQTTQISMKPPGT